MRTYIYLFLIAIIAVSCHKDSEFENEKVTSTNTPEVLNEVNGSVTGLVYDENNNPVGNALVSLYSGNTLTDERGVFRFSNIKLDPHGTYIRIKKEGFIDGSDKIFPAGGEAYSSTQLIALRKDQSFVSSAGAKIEAKNGGFVTFKENSIVKENGDAYSGLVYVTAHFLAAENDNIGDLMPGDLMADDELGRTVILGTAGMMAVELRGSNNEELNLKSGSTAQIEFPYTQASFPDEIDLWSFDENKGRWQIEGQASRKGDYYVAEVSHFSFWNCDVPFPLVNLCGKVVTENGTPIRTRITIATGSFGTMHGYTDSNGEFCGKVPKDAVLTIHIKDMFCPTIALTVTKGGFSNDVVLDDIVLDDLLPNIKGEVQCQAEKHDNSTVLLRSDGRTFVINKIDDGSFDVNLNTLCTDLPNLSIIGYDNETNQASNSEDVDLTSLPFYELEVCISPCAFEGALNYECGDDQISILLTNGTGTYSYLWSDGSTDNEVTLTSGVKSYCVTVTEDLTGCTKEYCQEAANGTISLTLSADDCSGSIFGTISSGVPPYSITSDHGYSQTSLNSNFFSDFQFDLGEYCYEITDKNGCITNGCVSGNFNGEFPFIEELPGGCEKNIYFYSGSDFVEGWVTDVFGNQFQLLNSPPRVDVLETGYALQSVTLFSNNGCTYESDIKLPFFRGLLPSDKQNTSCGTCSDGQITINVNPDEECFECDYGYTKVYNESLDDVTQMNDAGELSKGFYYVAAIDSVTTCFVAHELIEIE